jgi:hypothetical protein
VADLPVLVDHLGVPRVLAALPPYPWQPIPRLMETRAPLPRSEWREVDLTFPGIPILDQGRRNSCTGHMAATGMTVAWYLKTGELVRFAPTFTYAINAGGRDAGAVVSDIVTTLTTRGCCLESEYPEGAIDVRSIPPSAYQTAARYKLSRWHHTGSWDELCTALSLGWVCGGGFLLGNNFMQPGRDGIAPVPDRVVGGHAIALVGLVNRGGRWLVRFQNSWSASWGLQGYGYLTEEFFNYTRDVSARQWNAAPDVFTAEHVSDDPNSPLPVARDAA